jgi:hypothetical protein
MSMIDRDTKIGDIHFNDRLIHFVLILPVSTATTEWVFLAIKVVKIRIRKKK